MVQWNNYKIARLGKVVKKTNTFFDVLCFRGKEGFVAVFVLVVGCWFFFFPISGSSRHFYASSDGQQDTGPIIIL